MQAVILAGGKGTRLKDRLYGRPKPLVDVLGEPLLKRQIEHLTKYDFSELIILVNYKKELIEEFILDNDSFGMKITLIDDGEPKGTGGALLSVWDELDDTFLVVYGDTLFNVDLAKLCEFHERTETNSLTLFVHPNDHPYDSDLIEVNGDNKIVAFHPYPHRDDRYLPNIVNAAMYVFDKACLTGVRDELNAPYDLAKHVFPTLLEKGVLINAYNSPEYIKDIGTPDRLDKAIGHILSGRYVNQSLSKPQPSVFLDRDGTLNLPNGHINSHSKLTLYPDVGKNIRSLQDAGFRIILVTNQPVVARGEASLSDYQQIDAKLDSIIAKDGAYFDAKYVCMHHPDSGFEGEVAALKFDCDCRKPKPGMLLKAIADLNVDIENSWMIGDSSADFGAASKANIFSIGVRTGRGGKDGLHPYEPDAFVDDFAAATEYILTQS